MTESKCIEANNVQGAEKEPVQGPDHEQRQAPIAFRRALPNVSFVMLYAAPAPLASPPLCYLPNKYAMPAHIWRRSVHSFLELLRYRLSHSLESIPMFIYLAQFGDDLFVWHATIS
ncbi:hypothetical protein CMUS01_13257 [Colletotrichum musicola]|uniref:Uncharacterized protein n=1 Tax=Colletotrichum musicola TaxID=2175873 RepID=A0A8H6JF11_9PEZI|nr:hypothetical protein CMUS01_13257 [Colletotrichum musicola]